MPRRNLWVANLITAMSISAADALYQQDFSSLKGPELPDEFLVLDGSFSVKEDAGNRFAELPGAPLESYGFLFGPNESSGVEAGARILGTKSGRKQPTFSLGLNGASGYRLQVAPAKDTIELIRGDSIVASAPFQWKSGQWTQLRIRVQKISDTEYRVEGRVWVDGSPEPGSPMITFTETKLQPSGKASVWGMPFSGTPVRFDDLKVTRFTN